jgi:ankyrin repeat protein
MERHTISCCQNSATCSRPLHQWLSPQSFCRHNSNAIFGAIREDDIDLAKYIAKQIGDDMMTNLLTSHETVFGDTVLTYASSLGRLGIVIFFLDEIKRIVAAHSNTYAVSDLVNRETTRGKVAIIEAVKHGKADVVSTLLSNAGNAKMRSKTHGKSALEWAAICKDETTITAIQQHLQLSEHINSLFVAISNGDKEAVVSLTSGGTPYKPLFNSSPSLSDRLETLRSKIDEDKQKSSELQQLLAQEEPKLNAIHEERENRVKLIDAMRNERQELVSKRRKEFIEAVAILKLTTTDSNIAALDNTQSPLECELLSKSLCTLFDIKVNEEKSDSNTPYLQKMQSMMKDKHKFLHRIKHYHFLPHQAQLAASVQVDGIPGTCLDYISVLDESANLLGALMNSIARYLGKIFEQIATCERERDLLMKQRAEDDMLQRNTTDMEVLKSRCVILRRELGVSVDSVNTLQQKVVKLEREKTVEAVMNFKALNGHTVLSWAAAVGNVDIVKILLKHGGNTAIEERCYNSCAVIIQVAYRLYRWRRDRNSVEDLEQRERERCVNLRIRTLSNLFRDHLRNIRLPLSEAFFNGNSEVALLLEKSDISLFQAINMLHMFKPPCTTIPRPLTSPTRRQESNIDNLLSNIILAGSLFHEEESQASLDFASKTIDDFLTHKRQSLERKISCRRDTLFQKHRQEKILELESAMQQNNFDGMIKASSEACVSLDHEDATGMTPLIRAVINDSTTQKRYKRRPGGKEMSAVAYLLGRVSHLRPTVDYENKLGHTALTMACCCTNENVGVEIIRDLIDGGADINRQSVLDGNTPLHHACKAGNIDVATELIRFGADHTLKNNSNQTASDFAEGSAEISQEAR